MTTTLEEASQGFYEALNAMLAGDAVRAAWEGQAAAHLGGHVEGEELRHVASPTTPTRSAEHRAGQLLQR